jgi:hypothetical protein
MQIPTTLRGRTPGLQQILDVHLRRGRPALAGCAAGADEGAV